jgi:hypothetical protein
VDRKQPSEHGVGSYTTSKGTPVAPHQRGKGPTEQGGKDIGNDGAIQPARGSDDLFVTFRSVFLSRIGYLSRNGLSKNEAIDRARKDPVSTELWNKYEVQRKYEYCLETKTQDAIQVGKGMTAAMQSAEGLCKEFVPNATL